MRGVFLRGVLGSLRAWARPCRAKTPPSAPMTAVGPRPAWRIGLRASAVSSTLGALAAFAHACASPLSGGCAEDGVCVPDATGDDAETGASTDAVSDDTSTGPDAGADAVSSSDAPEEAPACDPSLEPKDDPCVLVEAYGVFVDSRAAVAGGVPDGATASDGSRLHPYPTIGEAIVHLATKKRIYVCNGAYGEQVRLSSTVSLFGGLSCGAADGGSAWAYVGASAQVTAPLPTYALTVTGRGGSDAGPDAAGRALADGGPLVEVTIEDMAFTAPRASIAGASSIAAFVDSATVHLARVALSAGPGADGLAGADGDANPNYTGAAPPGSAQVLGTGTNARIVVAPGTGGTSTCLRYGASAGGDGGLGCGSNGTPGTSTPPEPATLAGRDGDPRGTILADGGVVVVDDPGADGVANLGGVPADPQAYGTLSAAGWVPSVGGDGQHGNPGQGGAGGSDPDMSVCPGPPSGGGGGGGAGGCGGAGGAGGGGGGGSIALLALSATIDLREVALSTASSGRGGPGGAGQDGQPGALGGDNTLIDSEMLLLAHGRGAAGGNGAGGSGGAGGTGGVSIGVLYKDSTVVLLDSQTLLAADIGTAGPGGTAGPAGRYQNGVLTTGSDGVLGATGNPGISAPLLQLR